MMCVLVVVLGIGSAGAFRLQAQDNSNTATPDVKDVADIALEASPFAPGSFVEEEAEEEAEEEVEEEASEGVEEEAEEEVEEDADDSASWKPKFHYGCQVSTKKTGMMDRWVSVSPDSGLASKAKSVFNIKNWASRVKQVMGDTYNSSAEFSFDPFVMRSRTEYGGRILFKTVVVPHSGEAADSCIATYQANCPDTEEETDKRAHLQLIKKETCGASEETTKILRFSALKKKRFFCTRKAKKASVLDWNGQSSQDVYVTDANGQAHAVHIGNCVRVSTVNPTEGIRLDDLDSHMMGTGLKNLSGNSQKLAQVMVKVKDTVNVIAGSLAGAAGLTQGAKDPIEAVTKSFNVLKGAFNAGKDVVNATKEVNGTVLNASFSVGKTSVELVKKLVVSSMVETCLCCDAKGVDGDDDVIEHCKVAYTMGGQNQSQKLKYSTKAAAGTLYNLAQTAAGWLVPFVGGNIVRQSHKVACHYACGLREPLTGDRLNEPYQFGQVRKVPGMALNTWYIPNPATFFASATSEILQDVGGSILNGLAA